AVRNPPMQSLPTDLDIYKVKHTIIPHDGYVLLRADHSQAEIRLACHYGRELNMAAIIRSGKNQHQIVSDDLGLPYPVAKRLNFSVIYGIGAETLGINLGIREAQALKYLNKYHEAYPGFRRLYNGAQELARKNKYIVMWSGRRRHYNQGEYKTPIHKASSNLIQGGVAELMRCAQTRLDTNFHNHDVHQIAQVHDDAIMEVPIDTVEELAPAIRDTMEVRDFFMLPMTIDIKWGHNMADEIGSL
ncbi:hypothetical protein LCGC14_2835960, partial [marine sediment metagenome]